MFAIFRESDRNGTNANKSDDYDRKVIIVALRILNRLFFLRFFFQDFFFLIFIYILVIYILVYGNYENCI